MRAPRPTPDMPWWLRPERFVLFIILPIGIAISAAAAGLIETNRAGYSATVFLNAFYVTLFLSGIAAVALGAVLARRLPLGEADVRFRDGALDMLFLACMLGYAVWFGPVILSAPDLVLGALTAQEGAVIEIRERAPNVSGITTLTQFGIAYACIYATKRFAFDERPGRRYDAYMILIVLVALLRAAVYQERLAVIELVFPVLVILCKSDRLTGALPLRALRQTLPLVILAASPIFFAVFEYNRSWINHYQYEYDSYGQFVLERLGLYYVTALNNIAGLLENSAWGTYTGEWTLSWLYRLPVIGSLLSQAIGLEAGEIYVKVLDEYAHQEFNNATGVLIAHHDWGAIGGTLFLTAHGVLAGLAFRSFLRSRGFLQYFYPLILYSLFEILRIGYLYDGRCVAALIGLGIAYWGWGTKRAPDPAPGRARIAAARVHRASPRRPAAAHPGES